MEFESTKIPDVVIIRPDVFGDARGYFLEAWEARKYAASGLDAKFVQDNQSRSYRNVLRGLHYQIRHSQGKLVRVVAGEIFDVAVDLQTRSPTFGCWVGAILSETNHCALWVPPGFAHGFLALSEVADVVYQCTNFRAPEYERALLWNDPDIAVAWPLPKGESPVLSDKDARAVLFRKAEYFP